MNKKSVSATILVIFSAIFFSMIGVCFSSFVYKYTKTTVEAVGVVSAEGINIYKDEKLSQKTTKLELSKMELGLKPATGEVDAETQIPSTIDDKGTSEGYFASVYVQSDLNFAVKIDNIQIESEHDKLVVDEEKKNIFVAIKDVKDSVKTLEKNGTTIAEFRDVASIKKLTFLIWLGSFASDELEGAKISFSLVFSKI